MRWGRDFPQIECDHDHGLALAGQDAAVDQRAVFALDDLGVVRAELVNGGFAEFQTGQIDAVQQWIAGAKMLHRGRGHHAGGRQQLIVDRWMDEEDRVVMSLALAGV